MKRVVRFSRLPRYQSEIEWSGPPEATAFRLALPGTDSPWLEATIVEVEPGIYSVLTGGRSFEAKIVPSVPTGWAVDVDGRHFVLELADPLAAARSVRPASLDGQQCISSPMPGKVVRILVEVGDAVREGQGLVVVEAMKMQNELKAPRAGIVSALPVAAGEAVNPGDVLVVLE